MTPANEAKNTSVTPGTEIEVADYKSDALDGMSTIDSLLRGSRALIERALEDQSVFIAKEALLFTHGIALIGHALAEVDKTIRLLDEGIAEDLEAKKSRGIAPLNRAQGGVA